MIAADVGRVGLTPGQRGDVTDLSEAVCKREYSGSLAESRPRDLVQRLGSRGGVGLELTLSNLPDAEAADLPWRTWTEDAEGRAIGAASATDIGKDATFFRVGNHIARISLTDLRQTEFGGDIEFTKVPRRQVLRAIEVLSARITALDAEVSAP